MKYSSRRATAVIGTLAAATSVLAMAPAQTATLAPSHVTVHSTDYTPASGETFRLYGAVWSEGVAVPSVIRVKTYMKGEWVQLKGAVMHTNRDNGYQMRVILQMKGERQLRVVGNPDGNDIATSQKTITVTVH